jgi:hypothetical protein
MSTLAMTPDLEHNVAIMTDRKWLGRVGIELFSLGVLTYVGMCVWLMINQHRLVFGKRFPVVASAGKCGSGDVQFGSKSSIGESRRLHSLTLTSTVGAVDEDRHVLK